MDAALVLRRQHAEGSYNKKLARLAQHIATPTASKGVRRPQRLSHALYNGDLEAEQGPPQKAAEFKALLAEYQACSSQARVQLFGQPLLKNTIDW